MTIHKAKGLEFNTVFIPRLNEREFPTLGFLGKRYYHVLGGVFKKNKTKYQKGLDKEQLEYKEVVKYAQNQLIDYYNTGAQFYHTTHNA